MTSFPSLTMTDAFFEEIAGIVPKFKDEVLDKDFEYYFHQWTKAVKKHYQQDCVEYLSWLKAAEVLMIEYGNFLCNNNFYSDYRDFFFDWLFVGSDSRFQRAFNIMLRE